jgi:integrase
VLVSELLDGLVTDYALDHGHPISNQMRSHLKPIREAFGDMRAVHVTPKHVDKYIKRRQGEGCAAATINKETGILSRALKLGRQRDEIIAAPHIRRLTENNVRQGFFEPAQFESLVRALPEDLRDFVRFAWLTAWRRGQVASLTWEDWKTAAGVIIARSENVKNRELTNSYWRARSWRSSSGVGRPSPPFVNTSFTETDGALSIFETHGPRHAKPPDVLAGSFMIYADPG